MPWRAPSLASGPGGYHSKFNQHYFEVAYLAEDSYGAYALIVSLEPTSATFVSKNSALSLPTTFSREFTGEPHPQLFSTIPSIANYILLGIPGRTPSEITLHHRGRNLFNTLQLCVPRAPYICLILFPSNMRRLTLFAPDFASQDAHCVSLPTCVRSLRRSFVL